jgi:hypothetical protein
LGRTVSPALFDWFNEERYQMSTRHLPVKHLVGLCVFASLVVPVSAQEVRLYTPQLSMELGKFGFRVPIEARVVKGAPYVADVVTETIQWLSDGNRIVQRSSARVYRDKEGRIRREEVRPSGTPTISITDSVAGVSFSLDPENRIAFETPNVGAFRVLEELRKSHAVVTRLSPDVAGTFERAIGRGSLSAEFDAASDRLVLEKLPARDIEGVRVEGVRRTTTMPAGEIGNDLPIEIVSEEWFSPELQVLVLTERKDPRLGISTYRLQNIDRIEPASHLFEVPPDYTVRQPATKLVKPR